jgi:cold shock protein
MLQTNQTAPSVASKQQTSSKPKNGQGLEEGKVYHGVVKRYNPTRGFGFLRSDDGVDVFVHQSCVNMCGFRALNVGARVVFSAGVVMGTLQATDVTQETPYVPGGGVDGAPATLPIAPDIDGAPPSGEVPVGALLDIAPSFTVASPVVTIAGQRKELESLSLSESERARLLASFHVDDQLSSSACAGGVPNYIVSGSLPTELRFPALTDASSLPITPSGPFQGIPMFTSPTAPSQSKTFRAVSPQLSLHSSSACAEEMGSQSAQVAASAMFASGLISTHALPSSLATTTVVVPRSIKVMEESENSSYQLDGTSSSFAPSMLLSAASSSGNLRSVSRMLSASEVGLSLRPAANSAGGSLNAVSEGLP